MLLFYYNDLLHVRNLLLCINTANKRRTNVIFEYSCSVNFTVAHIFVTVWKYIAAAIRIQVWLDTVTKIPCTRFVQLFFIIYTVAFVNPER